MVGHRGEDRRSGAPHHEGVRHHGNHRRAGGEQESRVTHSLVVMPALVAGIHVLLPRTKDVDGQNKSGHDASNANPGETPLWLLRKSNSRSMRATRCCAASTFSPMP